MNVGGTGAGLTRIVRLGLTASGEIPLLALTVKVKTPEVVGVPDSTPLAGSRLRPSGRDPEAREKVGAGVPEAANV